MTAELEPLQEQDRVAKAELEDMLSSSPRYALARLRRRDIFVRLTGDLATV